MGESANGADLIECGSPQPPFIDVDMDVTVLVKSVLVRPLMPGDLNDDDIVCISTLARTARQALAQPHRPPTLVHVLGAL